MLKNIFNFLFDKFKHYIYCVRGTLLCLGLVSGVHYCLGLVSVQTFFILLKLFSFTVYFPSLKFSRCLPQKITSSSTIVWGHTIASSCFPEVMILIFSIISFTFSFAKVFFLLINCFLSFFHLKFSEMPNFQKYGALLKPNYKNLTQTIFQGGSP